MAYHNLSLTGAQLDAALGKAHTQNTDTGTTQSAFQIDSDNSGPQWKNDSGTLSARNAADGADAPVKGSEFDTGIAVSVINTEYTIWDIEDSNGDVVAKCTVECSNITDGSQDSEIHFYRMIAGTLTKVLTVNGS
jgi:hypothetical protein